MSSALLTWQDFLLARPAMAEFGQARISLGVMYLATLRADGSPRIHPITPFVSGGRLFAFMEPTSPKAKDLQRDGRYAMHSLVTDSDGTNGEFMIGGRATLLADDATRSLAVTGSPYQPKERYILFEFKLDRCLTNVYVDGNPNVQRWQPIPTA